MAEDILGTFLKQRFVECSSNVLETFLCDDWNLPIDQNLLMSNHTLLAQKQLFRPEFFKKFPNSSLDTWNIATLNKRSANIPGILSGGWVYWCLSRYLEEI